jgi:hypothetical protein
MENKEHPNVALINKLYDGLRNKVGEQMASCYTPDAEFSDSVFQSLKGDQVGDMVYKHLIFN